MPKRDQDYTLDYWEYSVAITDFLGDKWFNSLQIISDHINSDDLEADEDDPLNISSKSYQILQSKLRDHPLFNEINDLSIRKYCQTFVKNGFIEPGLLSYHPKVNEFLATKNFGMHAMKPTTQYFGCLVEQIASLPQPQKIRIYAFFGTKNHPILEPNVLRVISRLA